MLFTVFTLGSWIAERRDLKSKQFGTKQLVQSGFCGEYITGDVDQNYLDRVEQLRNDTAQTERRAQLQAEGAVVGLHNDA